VNDQGEGILPEPYVQDDVDYYPEGWVEFLKSVMQITYPTDYESNTYVELPINDLQKSNMHWAYEKTKHYF
jgi:hypothetical protein